MFNPGFSSVTISNRAELDLVGPLPSLHKGGSIKSEISQQMMAVFEEDWKKIISSGLADLADKVKARVGGP
jgi:hypothetical protein